MKVNLWIKANGMEYVQTITVPSKADFAEVKQELHKFESTFQPNWYSKPTYYQSGFEVVKSGKKK